MHQNGLEFGADFKSAISFSHCQLFICLHLPVHLSLHLPVGPTVHFPCNLSLHLPVSQSVHLPCNLSLNLQVCVTISVSQYLHFPISLCVYHSISPFLPVSLSPPFQLINQAAARYHEPIGSSSLKSRLGCSKSVASDSDSNEDGMQN